MAAQPIKVPDIGDFDSVEVIEVLVSPGEHVKAEQPLISLESDKATLEVPAPGAGTITEIKISEGANVSQGDLIAEMTPDEASDSGAPDNGDTSTSNSEAQATAGSNSESNADSGAGDPASGVGSNGNDDNNAGSGGGQTSIQVPDIGDFDSVEVIEVLVSAGDDVAAEQPIITLESDKATLEVPAPASGSIVEMTVSEGANVSQGDVIGTLEQAGAAAPAAETGASAGKTAATESGSQADSTSSGATSSQAPAEPAAQSAPAVSTTSNPSTLKSVDENGFTAAHASPNARRFARQLGADLARIEGTGRKGRVLEEDIQNYVRQALDQVQSGNVAAPAAGGGLPTQPDVDFSEFGDIETVKLSRIRKISAKAVHDNWLLIPHVTQFESADITDLEEFRQANKELAKADGVKLTPLAFLLKATAAALTEFPDLNSSLAADGEHLVQKKYVNIAVAVDTPNGLLMPVVKDVDKKGIYDIARDLDAVSTRAREGKIKGDDLKGACFSISSLGGVGGNAFTPIVNSPEVGILGVSKHDWQPVWQDGQFVPRLLLPLSFSYDHRVIDGAEAARITNFISRSLGDLRTLIL